MSIETTALPSGVTVITEHMNGVRSAALGFFVRTGSRDEAPGQEGISHFLEHMMFKGTPSRDAVEISMAFDALGAEADAFTTRESTCYYVRMMDQKLPACFEIMADMLVNSLFRQSDIDTEREVVLEEIAQAEDTFDDCVFDVFDEALFPGHPYGKPILGDRDVVSSFTQQDLLRYHEACYSAGNVTVVACGSVDHDQVVHLAQQHLQDLPVGERRVRAPFACEKPLPLTALAKECEQANIVLGWPAEGAAPPKRFVLSMLDAVLGGGMSSRLFTEVREKRGLVYSVYSVPQLSEGVGQLMVYAGTRPGNIQEVLSVIKGVLSDLARNGVEEEEFQRVREMVCGNYVLACESPRSHMTRLGKMSLNGIPVADLDATIEGYRSVTLKEVNEMAAELLSKEPTIAVISPYSYEEIERMI